ASRRPAPAVKALAGSLKIRAAVARAVDNASRLPKFGFGFLPALIRERDCVPAAMAKPARAAVLLAIFMSCFMSNRMKSFIGKGTISSARFRSVLSRPLWAPKLMFQLWIQKRRLPFRTAPKTGLYFG